MNIFASHNTFDFFQPLIPIQQQMFLSIDKINVLLTHLT